LDTDQFLAGVINGTSRREKPGVFEHTPGALQQRGDLRLALPGRLEREAQGLLGPQTFQFAGRPPRHQLQERFGELGIRQGAPPDDRDQANRPAVKTPERDARVALGRQFLKHRVFRKTRPHPRRKAANRPADHLAARSVFQGIRNIVLELAITVHRDCPSR
jgi:hypothetical protein